MPGQEIILNTGNQMIVNNSTPRIFLWNYRTAPIVLSNATAYAVALAAGTLLGRVTADQKMKPLASGASDGSQYPRGVLFDDVIIPPNTTVFNAFMADSGDVSEDRIIFQGSDTLATVVDGATLRDRIQADSVGLKLIKSTEMSGAYDNQ